MVLGPDKDDARKKTLDVQAGGQSMGVPADGEVEGNSVRPMGTDGVNHWQASYIERGGLDDRGNIFFAAVAMTRMPMLITDPRQDDNPIVFVNGAFLDLTGYTEDQVMGRNCRMLQGPDTDRTTVAELRRAVDERRAVAVDLLNYKADGSPFWNALFFGPIFDQDGNILYFFASQMDISERRSNQESYLQAQKMEAIGQLSAGMAHDFNNLLQVINGNLEVALLGLKANGAAESKASEPIRRAQRATMQAGKLTQQLLTFARKQRLEAQQLSLNSLVVDFSDMLVRTLGDRIDLRLDLKPGLPACTVDPTYLEMALLNVVLNARDAMPEGGAVTVGTATLTPERRRLLKLRDGDYVCICVHDEGQGMAPEIHRAVLHYQGPGHRPRTGDGARLRAAVARPARHRKRARPGHAGTHGVPGGRPGRDRRDRPRRRPGGDERLGGSGAAFAHPGGRRQ
jgi:PAS domain S-box-containing protein